MLLISLIFICIILALSKIPLFKKYLDLVHLFYFKHGNFPLFVEYISPYFFFFSVLPIMWDCLCFLLVSVLLKPSMPYFEFLHPCFLCIGALLTPFPTFREIIFPLLLQMSRFYLYSQVNLLIFFLISFISIYFVLL